MLFITSNNHNNENNSRRLKFDILSGVRFLKNSIHKKSSTSSVYIKIVSGRSVLWTMIGTTALGFSWLALAKTEEVVVTGKLVPIGDVQEVQLPIGGVVSEILVTDGQRVWKGDTLSGWTQSVFSRLHH